ncbi:MAG: bifunctional 4-hydroxy-2-oxoglutarate aldolase/2-dehydro-3-deoxy-phosphogluconate aldolase [Pseudoflavonifractor sp.]
MNEVLQRIYEIGIIPVIAIEDAAKAVPLAKALHAGGLPAAEVTFRTEAGEEAIRQMAQQCPEVLVGAGTILNEEQSDRAIAAGAKFIVSPGYNDALVAHCQKKGIPVLPGCVNASDMTRAVNAGLEIVKFFPAEQSGGVAFLKALAPVFGKLRFMPTGGVSTKNLTDYLGFDRIIACGGTWMVKKELIEGEQWDEITAICKDAVSTMLDFRLWHIGVNCADECEAKSSAHAFATAFGLGEKNGSGSIFAGTMLEYMKAPGMGKYGHIAISTRNLDRAIYHLGLQGVKFDESSRKVDDKGRTTFIYLADEISGFAIHFIQV